MLKLLIKLLTNFEFMALALCTLWIVVVCVIPAIQLFNKYN